MGKTGAKNLDLKSKLSIVSGIIANAKKDIESFKNEFNDFKTDHAMSKTGLNSLKLNNLVNSINSIMIF